MGELHPPIAAPLHDLTTERMSLRRIEPDDLDELAAMFAEPQVWEFPLGRGLTRAETVTWCDGQLKLWADCDFGGCTARVKATKQLLGVVGLGVPVDAPELLPAVSVGWRFSPSAWGNGYATEGASALLDQAFTTMQLDRVVCVTQPENVASVRVAERLGMRLVGAVGSIAVAYEISAVDWKS